jgi:hypothetical protein
MEIKIELWAHVQDKDLPHSDIESCVKSIVRNLVSISYVVVALVLMCL